MIDLDQLKMLPICSLHQIVCFLQRNLYRSIIMWTKIVCSTDYDRLRIYFQIVYIIAIKQKRNLFDRWRKSICSRSHLSFLLDWLSRQPQKMKMLIHKRDVHRLQDSIYSIYQVLKLQPFNYLWYSIQLVCNIDKFCHHFVFIGELNEI